MWDIYTCCYKGKARARKKILSSCRFRKRCEVEEGQVTYQSHLIPKIITVLLHRSKGKNIIGGTFCLPSILFLLFMVPLYVAKRSALVTVLLM